MAERPRIIGVSGFLRTGKDSVAALLQEFGYERTSFADPLRKMALDIDPTIDMVEAPEDIRQEVNFGQPLSTYSILINTVGYERAKEVPDFRRFLQRLGTEGVRGNFGQDAWVNLFIEKIEAAGPDAQFVVPDVRFPNEANVIKELGGVVWRTERPGFEPVPVNGKIHPSEAMVLEITPDVTLRADSLVDRFDEEGNIVFGLGTLVLRQLGIELYTEGETEYEELLNRWAGAILTS